MKWRALAAFVVALAAAALPGGRAAAVPGQVFFDFAAPFGAQSGAYVASAGAVVAAGVGRLQPPASSAWYDEAWRARRSLLVTAGDALDEFPLRLVLDVAADPALAEIFNTARPDGADLRLLDAGGALVSPTWVEEFDAVYGRAVLWARLTAGAGAVATYHLYYGEPGATDVSDAEAVFTSSAPRPLQVVLNAWGAGLDHAALPFFAGTALVAGATTFPLALGAVTTVPGADLAAGATVASDKPAFLAVPGADTSDAPVPLSLAAAAFTYPANRGVPNVFGVHAPFGAADVTLRANGVAQICDGAVATSCAVPAGGTLAITVDVAANAVVDLDATAPVVAAHWGGDNVDAHPFAPPATELWGFQSGTPRIAGTAAGTAVTAYLSDGTTVALAVGDDAWTSLAAGTFLTGAGVRLVASAPIAAYANGEGDGGDAVTFLPRDELGTSFVVPTAADYVRLVTTGVGTTCVRDQGGALTMAAASVSTPPPHPGLVSFGATAAGAIIDCDAPAWGAYEDAATQDERELLPWKLYRAAVALPPVVGPAGPPEPRYPTAPETIVTPTWTSPTGVNGWTGFRATTSEPAGTSVRFQLSTDGGVTWLWHDGAAWTFAAFLTQANDEAAVDAAIAALGPAPSVTVRAVLSSTDGTETPLVDSITVDVDEAGPPARLFVSPVLSPQAVNVPFTVAIEALDANDAPVVGFAGPVTLAANDGTPLTPATVTTFVAGLASVDVTFLSAASGVQLVAMGGGAIGFSNAFDVLGAPPAALEYVSGDGQFGPAGALLDAPVVVRAVDGGGAPVGGAVVTFSATEGGGAVVLSDVDPGAPGATVTTGADGLATAWWRLGDAPGPNRLDASAEDAAGGALVVSFVARGDDPADDGGGGGGRGGCGCDVAARSAGAPGTAPGARAAAPLAAALLGLVLVLSRSRALARAPARRRGVPGAPGRDPR